MGVIYLNISFEGLFKGCFQWKKQTSLQNFTNTLNNVLRNETKINMILEKICNGKFDLVLLYKVENRNRILTNYYGDYEKIKLLIIMSLISLCMYQIN